MPRVTTNEVRLSFERLLVDAEDDFFPDPLWYRDLRFVENEVVDQVAKGIRACLRRLAEKPNSGYAGRQFFNWDVPKNHDVVRHGVCIHPFDRIAFNFIVNRLVPLIEPGLSPARYSHKVAKPTDKYLFGKRHVKNWLAWKSDAKNFFDAHKDYTCLVSTDVAGFYEYTHIAHFKKKLFEMTGDSTQSVKMVVDLLNAMLRCFSPSGTEGIPQNYDPSSYLASAFLDFLDKELEACDFRHFRYLDDIKVACRDRRHAQKAIIEIIHALRRFNLNLSTAKTEIWQRGAPEFAYFFRDFPPLLDFVDTAVRRRDKGEIDKLLPELVKLTMSLMRKHGKRFDDRQFRACIGRILKCHWFKNIRTVSLDGIAKRCLLLLDEMPGWTDTFARFLVLLKNKKFVQSGCAEVIQSTIYSWQEQLLWALLAKASKVADKQLLALARDRVRTRPDNCPGRNLAIVFLGRHGTYHDREFIASLAGTTNSFMALRCVLIAIQEYQDRTTIYNAVASRSSDLLVTGLVRYLKQLKRPQYVLEDNKIRSDLCFVLS